jgi:hypothetical protein
VEPVRVPFHLQAYAEQQLDWSRHVSSRRPAPNAGLRYNNGLTIETRSGSSVWKFIDDRWLMVFHLGTVLNEP